MPHIDADNLTAVGAVIFALAWLGFWADGHPIARKVSGVPWVLTAALLLSNTGIIPMQSPAYGFVGQYLLPLGIPMLLFKANVRTVLTEGARVLPPFLIACVGSASVRSRGFSSSTSGRPDPRSPARTRADSSAASRISSRSRRPSR
jgi:hypothetical protein